MKFIQRTPEGVSTTYRNVPVVRLDSGAVKIPVELVENISRPDKGRRVLRIRVTNHSFCAWR